MTDIIFDVESKIREALFGKINTLGLQNSEIPEGKKPEPEKIEPPKEPTPSPQPYLKTYVEGSPKQRNIGNLRMIENQ
jgi:hypothetical protein